MSEIAQSERLENWHKEAMARLKEQATIREAELNTHTELMAQEYNGAMGRLREQVTS